MGSVPISSISSMKDAIQRMTSKGVWLSEGVIDFALYHAGEKGF